MTTYTKNRAELIEASLAYLAELDDQLATAKVISDRREQDQALESLSEEIIRFRTFLIEENKL